MCNIENNSSQHSQGIWRLKSIYFTFSCYLSHDYTSTIHLPQWTQPIQLTVIALPSVVLTHASSFIWILHYLSGTTQLSPSSINFPLSQPIPETQNNKREDKKKPRRRPWKPIMIWHYKKVARCCTKHKQNHKWSSKYQKHKTDTMTQSHGSQGKLNLSHIQYFMAVSLAMQFPASYFYKHISVNV